MSSAPVSFTFGASLAGSTFQCRLDGPGSSVGTYQTCTSPASYNSLATGSYTFYVRAALLGRLVGSLAGDLGVHDPGASAAGVPAARTDVLISDQLRLGQHEHRDADRHGHGRINR